MRPFLGVMLALSVGLYVAYDKFVKGAPDASDQADRLAKLKKKYGEEFDEFAERFEKAKTSAERKGIQTEVKELSVLTLEKTFKIVEDDPKSEAGFNAAYFGLVRILQFTGPTADADKLLDLVAEHHMTNAKMRDIVLMAPMAGKAGQKFLATVSEKSTDKPVKGTALFILGMAASEQSDEAPNDKAATELVAKAIDLLERAAKEAPETKVEDGTIGKLAVEEIAALKTLSIGNAAPDVEGTDLRDGKKVKLSSFKGNVVLIDVWGTFCPPCRAMIPHERAMAKRLAGRPFKLVSVSMDEKKADLTKFLEKESMPWTHWWDDGEENPLVKTLRVKNYPSLFLIDAKGVIRKKWLGMVPGDDPASPILEQEIEKLLKEAATKG